MCMPPLVHWSLIRLLLVVHPFTSSTDSSPVPFSSAPQSLPHSIALASSESILSPSPINPINPYTYKPIIWPPVPKMALLSLNNSFMSLIIPYPTQLNPPLLLKLFKDLRGAKLWPLNLMNSKITEHGIWCLPHPRTILWDENGCSKWKENHMVLMIGTRLVLCQRFSWETGCRLQWHLQSCCQSNHHSACSFTFFFLLNKYEL